MARWILHVDLDQFLAAVEVRRHPELRGRPVVVGGSGDPTQPRKVVASASYEARAFGVHAGMPLRTAARKCPEAVFLPSDNPTYELASAEVMDTLRRFPVIVEVWDWDEAAIGADTDDPEALATALQRAVLAETQLHCSIGIGDNKLRAKTATSFAKPAGRYRLTSTNWLEVMGDRPTEALWGVGAKTANALREYGVRTMGDLASLPVDLEDAGPEAQVDAVLGVPLVGAQGQRVGRVGPLEDRRQEDAVVGRARLVGEDRDGEPLVAGEVLAQPGGGHPAADDHDPLGPLRHGPPARGGRRTP
jgi:nucleotidyltransferase/DNA polymerase involved in DNA repair